MPGGLDEVGREALLKYILRPAVALERVARGPDGLVRIRLKQCASVPPPRVRLRVHVAIVADPIKRSRRCRTTHDRPATVPRSDDSHARGVSQ